MTKATFVEVQTWSDDHLPCVSFDYKGHKYQVCWTSHQLVARAEMVSEGEITVAAFMKKFPELAEVMKAPMKETTNFDYIEDDGGAYYNTNVGGVTVWPLW